MAGGLVKPVGGACELGINGLASMALIDESVVCLSADGFRTGRLPISGPATEESVGPLTEAVVSGFIHTLFEIAAVVAGRLTGFGLASVTVVVVTVGLLLRGGID